MIRRQSSRVFHGWWIVASGFLIQLLIAVLLQRAFAAYVVLFRDQFGWSKTALSGAFSLQQVENGLLGPLQGGVIDRFGPRASMRVGMVFFGLGFLVLSQMNSLPTSTLKEYILREATNLGEEKCPGSGGFWTTTPTFWSISRTKTSAH